jgi:hypothetical protein
MPSGKRPPKARTGSSGSRRPRTRPTGGVASKLEGLGNPYDFGFGWDSEGDFYTDHYYREHMTTSGWWGGEQRTVSACVRFEMASGQVTGASVDCPDKRPYSDYVDEWVTVP